MQPDETVDRPGAARRCSRTGPRPRHRACAWPARSRTGTGRRSLRLASLVPSASPANSSPDPASSIDGRSVRAALTIGRELGGRPRAGRWSRRSRRRSPRCWRAAVRCRRRPRPPSPAAREPRSEDPPRTERTTGVCARSPWRPPGESVLSGRSQADAPTNDKAKRPSPPSVCLSAGEDPADAVAGSPQRLGTSPERIRRSLPGPAGSSTRPTCTPLEVSPSTTLVSM